MILVGNQRGGGAQLARHLMNVIDNDHITVHELRGFVDGSLLGAFNEAHAISKGTRCQQYLFSLSFNPPPEQQVSKETFLEAIERAEDKLGLSGQPRAIVFHEKEGRRHAHAVWSRIDIDAMKAINLPHFKTKLARLSKELYLDNGWELPRGHRENGWKNPLNYTLEEFQQAKRLGLDDPREVKQVFHQAFTGADSVRAFKGALEASGYYLAQGDRRGMVALDLEGNVYSVARWAGVKTKALRDKFGEPEKLPSVDQTKTMIRQNLSDKMRAYMAEMRGQYRKKLKPFYAERTALVERQRLERTQLADNQKQRWQVEERARAARYRKGLMGAYDLLTGKVRTIRRENEAETLKNRKRDLTEREGLFFSQHKDRRNLQKRLAGLRQAEITDRQALKSRIAEVMGITREHREQPARQNDRSRGRDRSLDLSL